MTVHEVTVADRRSVLAALADPQPSWVTLAPDGAPMPEQLITALSAFDAGDRPAALVATRWLKTQALACYATARTRLLVADGRVTGFYALASAQVALRQRDRTRLGLEPVRAPAALVAWIAKDVNAAVDGKLLLLHAAATARRAAALQATSLLVVDPFDEQTATMWRKCYGFRPSAEPSPRRRLWLPLHAVD